MRTPHTNSIDNPQNYTSVQQSATQTSKLLQQALPLVLPGNDLVLIPSLSCFLRVGDLTVHDDIRYNPTVQLSQSDVVDNPAAPMVI